MQAGGTSVAMETYKRQQSITRAVRIIDWTILGVSLALVGGLLSIW
jgi:hypothetical protein